MKRLNAFTFLLLTGISFAAPTPDLAKGKHIADTICAACHGADGNTNSSTYPRLAGQMSAYIIKQTHEIKSGSRTTGTVAKEMAPLIQNLSDDDIRNVAAYFSKQSPKSGESNPKIDPALGQKIFRGGLAEKKVPACMSCHGANGNGMPASGTNVNAFPRIGGQQAPYVVEQLKAYASGERKSPNGMMETIAKRLSEDDMKAVGNFIQGLH